jgi:CRP/FNR family transcriptional regulator, nitrogen oxide reductase regulator
MRNAMDANEHRQATLRDAELFQGLDDRALRALVTSCATRHVAAGMALLKQGDAPRHLFMVAAGRFKMTSVSREGSQTTLRFMNPGDIIGCAAVFRGIPYPATATAVTESTAMSWTAPQFVQFLRTYPRLAENSLSIVGERASEMLQRLREATTEPVEQRIARALLRLAHQASPGDRGKPVSLKLSRQDLAELSGTSLYTASRVISAWSRARIVEGGRQRIRVLDAKQLRIIAGL